MDSMEHEVRALVERHRIHFHVLPEWGTDARWNPQKTGFQVELYGSVHPDAPSGDAPPLDAGAIQTSHRALRCVAEWAFGSGNSDVSLSIDPFRANVVREPSEGGWVVELVGHVLHSGDVRRPVDATEESYLTGIKERLSSVGATER